MTPEELLKPRYKVIADYPKSLYHVGDIINAGTTSEDCIYCDREGPRMRHYPHLFKLMAWWEERKPEEMPGYVRHIEKGAVYIVTHHFWNSKGCMLVGALFAHYAILLPATREEYEAYLKIQT